MLIRATWAKHPRSRNGGGDGDGGAGTSRTVVRFIMGQPRKTWERRIRVEMEGAHVCLLPYAVQPYMGMLRRVQRYRHTPRRRKHELRQELCVLYLGSQNGVGPADLL